MRSEGDLPIYRYFIFSNPASRISTLRAISCKADSLPKLAHAQEGCQMKYTLEIQFGKISITDIPIISLSTLYTSFLVHLFTGVRDLTQMIRSIMIWQSRFPSGVRDILVLLLSCFTGGKGRLTPSGLSHKNLENPLIPTFSGLSSCTAT
jgi:hypothetical protein